MKFFKHFCDAHRGRTIQTLFELHGHMGVACYWILVELCAEKLEKDSDEVFTAEHCVFSFHERTLRQSLRVSSTKLESFLNKLSELSQLSFKKVGNIFEIEFSKLLESLDRDSKRARTARAVPAPKKKRKIKKEEKDKEYTSEFEVVWKNYPRKSDKTDAFLAFQANVSPEEIPLVSKAIENYRTHLANNQTETKFIKHGSTFFNKGRWRDWLDPEAGKAEDFSESPKLRSITEILAEEEGA